MPKRPQKQLIGAAISVFAALGYFLYPSSDDESDRAIKSVTSPSASTDPTKIFPSFTPLAVGDDKDDTPEAPGLGASAPEEEEIQTKTECISQMFMARAKSATLTPDEKFSNLRWAIELYKGNTGSTAMFDTAAQSLGIDKRELVSQIRTAAINVFKKTSTANLRSNWDWANYWNDQIIAHEYAGVTDTGEYNARLSEAAISYSENQLTKNRDQYMQAAVTEIAPSLKITLDAMSAHIKQQIQNGQLPGPARKDFLESLTHDQQITLREQLNFALYTFRRMPYPEILGFTSDNVMEVETASQSGYLSPLIYDHFAKECKIPQPR